MGIEKDYMGNTMPLIAILSDAHLLMQAEWIEDENRLIREGEEVLENFERGHKFGVRKINPKLLSLLGICLTTEPKADKEWLIAKEKNI